jgi:hypothetical protein
MRASHSAPPKPWRLALRWGVALGIAVCVWTLALHALGWYTTNPGAGLRADQVATVLPAAALFFALRERTRIADRQLSFREAAWTGLLTGWFSLPISSAFLWVYHHHINPRWLEVLISHHRDRLTRLGTPDDAIARYLDAQRASGGDTAQLIGAVVGTTLISLLISAIVWGLWRLKRKHGV